MMKTKTQTQPNLQGSALAANESEVPLTQIKFGAALDGTVSVQAGASVGAGTYQWRTSPTPNDSSSWTTVEQSQPQGATFISWTLSMSSGLALRLVKTA